MDITAILTNMCMIATAFGGYEGVKWFRNRRAQSRQETAAAEDAEHTNQRKQVDWLEQRLGVRDAKVDALYAEVRKLENEKLQLTETISKVRLENMLLKMQKCEVRGCAQRQPPNEY